MHGGDIYLDISLFDDGHLQGDEHEAIFKAFYGLTCKRAREIHKCLDPFFLSSADYFCVEESEIEIVPRSSTEMPD